MAKYTVYAKKVVSLIVEVEAEDEDAAIEAAIDISQDTTLGICCSMPYGRDWQIDDSGDWDEFEAKEKK